MRGNPFRLTCSKKTGEVRVLSFANFSHTMIPDSAGGLTLKRIDYSKNRFTIDGEFRNAVGNRLMAVGTFLENALGGPQDIEGALLDNEIFLLQSRPQQGLP